MSDQRDNRMGYTVTIMPDGTEVPARPGSDAPFPDSEQTKQYWNKPEEVLPPSPAPMAILGDPNVATGKVVNGVFTCTEGKMKGEKIEVFKVSPTLVQKVIQSVKMPRRPTYETRTFSGRVEVHPMDEIVAQQTPGYQGLWDQYIEDKNEVEAERNERLATVLLSRGTRYKTPEGWEEEHAALGVVVPTEPNAKRAHYLAVEMDPADLNDLVKEILRLTGITEEKIKEAEASFRN